MAGAAIAARRLTLWLVAAFGLTALFLAVVGIYGVMNQAVRQRTHEFGVRQALGATRGDILRLVLSSGAILSVVGLCGGVLLAILSTRLFAVDALPRQRVRSAHVCVRHAGAARRRVVRGVPPGTARDAREPVDRATGDGIAQVLSHKSEGFVPRTADTRFWQTRAAALRARSGRVARSLCSLVPGKCAG